MSQETKKVRMGMVGGGRGAFIGPVHRMAVALDGTIDLVAGCFSRDFANTQETGRQLGISASRCYRSFHEMAQAERDLPAGERIDFVSIVTPPKLHFPVAIAFLESGFSVLCDKPVTNSLEQARNLADTVRRTGLLFGVTQNYTGYPLVRQARYLVQSGAIGSIRRVLVEYLQDCLALPQQPGPTPWRLDPAQMGGCGSMGEAGVHCASLLEYITGDKIAEVCADRTTFLPGRVLEEDASILVRLGNGGRGTINISQIATGEDNNLSIRIYGSEGALLWNQESPDQLQYFQYGKPRQTLIRGHAEYLSEHATRSSRLPPGHPEGFLEAFCNIYSAFAHALRQRRLDQPITAGDCDFPTIEDGVRTMAFVDAAVRSCNNGSAWARLSSPDAPPSPAA